MSIEKSLLSDYLFKTVQLLKNSPRYEWGNSGACNCGHLAQVMTGKSRKEIHEVALKKEGDWSDKSKVYCESSGHEIDDVISIMLSKGLQLEDIRHIEYLSNPKVLEKVPPKQGELQHNNVEDVITYFNAWILLLRESAAISSSWQVSRINESDVLENFDCIPESDLVKK
mgnify:CR=1 FL=1